LKELLSDTWLLTKETSSDTMLAILQVRFFSCSYFALILYVVLSPFGTQSQKITYTRRVADK